MAKCYILGFVGQTWCLDALHEFLISPELSSDKKLRFCLGCNSSTVLLSYEENPALFFFFLNSPEYNGTPSGVLHIPQIWRPVENWTEREENTMVILGGS